MIYIEKIVRVIHVAYLCVIYWIPCFVGRYQNNKIFMLLVFVITLCKRG